MHLVMSLFIISQFNMSKHLISFFDKQKTLYHKYITLLISHVLLSCLWGNNKFLIIWENLWVYFFHHLLCMNTLRMLQRYLFATNVEPCCEVETCLEHRQVQVTLSPGVSDQYRCFCLQVDASIWIICIHWWGLDFLYLALNEHC